MDKKEELNKLYNYAKLKLKNKQYTKETRDLLNEVVQESEKYNFTLIYNNALKDYEFCREMRKKEKKKELMELYNDEKLKIENE